MLSATSDPGGQPTPRILASPPGMAEGRSSCRGGSDGRGPVPVGPGEGVEGGVGVVVDVLVGTELSDVAVSGAVTPAVGGAVVADGVLPGGDVGPGAVDGGVVGSVAAIGGAVGGVVVAVGVVDGVVVAVGVVGGPVVGGDVVTGAVTGAVGVRMTGSVVEVGRTPFTMVDADADVPSSAKTVAVIVLGPSTSPNSTAS